MGHTASLSRRRFLTATGLVTTAAAASQLPGFTGRWPARAQSADDLLGPLLDSGVPLLQALAHDTIAGVIAFVVPGDDPYSRAQGVVADDLGGVQAKGPEFLMDALDQFFPFPDSYLQALAASMITGSSDLPVPLLGELTGSLNELTSEVDQALLALFENDQTVPLSLVFAMVINLAASAVRPDAVTAGTFLSPFANLDFDGKMDSWQYLEEDTTALLAQLDGDLPEPLARSLSGLVAFAAGALVEFAAFGSYSEWGVFDAQTGTATRRPPGWEMSNYLPGRSTPVDGHDELIGYYRGVRAARGSWDRTGRVHNA